MNAPWTPSEDMQERHRLLTVADVDAMIKAGLMSEDDRVELIEGVLVELASKNISHERAKNLLGNALNLGTKGEVILAYETTLRLSTHTYVEPDIVVVDKSVGFEGLNGETALLVVEVAESSLAYDRDTKAPLYAAYGVRDYWLVNLVKNTIVVHRDPAPDGYETRSTHRFDEPLSPLFRPDLSFKLAELLA